MLEGDAKNSLVENDIKEEIKPSSNIKRNVIISIAVGVVVLAILVVLIIFYIQKDKEEEDPNKLEFLTWEEAHKRAKEKLKDFTDEEKLSMLYGIQNMAKKAEEGGCCGYIEPIKDKFGGICLQDGPAGVRFATSTQSWQASINTASTFNRTLMYKVGKAQGKDFREKGVHVALGPAMNIQRSPQGGRLWESYGDDPFLAGEVATQIIKGIQSNGVIACAKHFTGNDQETNRKNSSSNIKEQALWEIYLEPFYRSIKDAEVGSMMAGYNAINGQYCINNSRLMNEILKGKFEYKGFIMSDWWTVATNSSKNFIDGVDMNMPGGFDEGPNYVGRDKSFWSNFSEYLGNEISYERLDDAVERILAPMYKLDQFSSKVKYPDIDFSKNTITEETKKLNREAATQSNVLLKNKNNILPIKNNIYKKIAVIGNDAFPSPCIQYGDCSCKHDDNFIYQGHLGLGYGSGTTTFKYLIDPLSAITDRAKKEDIEIISSGEQLEIVEKIIDENHTVIVGKENIEKAKEVAKEADLCLVFVMADSGEQYIDLEESVGDRYDLNAWHSGNELIEAVLEVNQNVIVIINSPGPINLPWLNKIKGLIHSGLGGAESGNGIADILFGYYNPSGHLPYVWGKNEDYPSQIDIFSNPTKYEYTEGVFVGQRYFDKNNVEPIFPFGYGLSYTTFEFQNDLEVSMNKEGLKINFSVKNTGDMDGETVPMVFLKFPVGIKTEDGYPSKLFKGFDKKWVKKGEIVKFEISVDAHALSYYDIDKKDYIRPNQGQYTVYVGFDANDYKKLEKNVDAKY